MWVNCNEVCNFSLGKMSTVVWIIYLLHGHYTFKILYTIHIHTYIHDWPLQPFSQDY